MKWLLILLFALSSFAAPHLKRVDTRNEKGHLTHQKLYHWQTDVFGRIETETVEEYRIKLDTKTDKVNMHLSSKVKSKHLFDGESSQIRQTDTEYFKTEDGKNELSRVLKTYDKYPFGWRLKTVKAEVANASEQLVETYLYDDKGRLAAIEAKNEKGALRYKSERDYERKTERSYHFNGGDAKEGSLIRVAEFFDESLTLLKKANFRSGTVSISTNCTLEDLQSRHRCKTKDTRGEVYSGTTIEEHALCPPRGSNGKKVWVTLSSKDETVWRSQDSKVLMEVLTTEDTRVNDLCRNEKKVKVVEMRWPKDGNEDKTVDRYTTTYHYEEE